MPTYQYVCTECGGQLEAVQKFTDEPLTVHDACGGRLRKVFSPVGIVFKGSGFYRTDSRDKKSTASSSSSSPDSPKSGSSESKTDSSSSDSPKSPGSSDSSGAKDASPKSSSSSSGEKVA
ncbi:MAG: FmdB family transcriptional regulator [Nocardiopsaceae bacterium]|nr:FmdB family transcriptional regulator [Nocardiopsaceae bacterium]